ncbi:MAG TPA: site-2 protease family protein [Candidatus Dormibacteraeota bacterium]|nr:site-2 protease family protein [Candidatus Dormibacteraeota bacterium]
MHRVYLGFAIVVVVIAVIAIIEAARTKEPVLNHAGFWMLFLLTVQWLMILPHELGHAFAARLFGYTQIRMLIGMGKPLFSFDFAGFYWVFNPIPFGGLTLAQPPAKMNRWKHLTFVSAGLAVNALFAFVAWLFIGPDGVAHSPSSVAKLLFWGNAIVVAENLIPRGVQTSAGSTFSDGWQIWHVLFRWNRPRTRGSERVPSWEVFVCHILKWCIVGVLIGGTIFFAVVVFMPFLPSFRSTTRIPLVGTVLWSALFIGLASVCAWYAVRVLRQPIATVRKRTQMASLSAEYHAAFTSEQFETYKQMAKLLQTRDFAHAATLVEQLMPAVSNHNSDGYVQLLLVKLNCLLGLNQIEQAETLCLDYTQRDVSKEQKVKVLDGLASYLLYQESSAFLKLAERFARMGLEIAPGTLTLKGTLGSILIEQGNYAEGEPLLRDCLNRSLALQDRAIASFYLGLLQLRTGHVEQGERLMKRGMKMYPEPWLVTKGNKLLHEG